MTPTYFSVYTVFEAMISFWFTQCRMDPSWWGFLDADLAEMNLDWISVRRQVSSLMDHIYLQWKYEGGDYSGAMAPLYMCMQAMVNEMDNRRLESKEKRRGDGFVGDEAEDNERIEQVLVTMKVMSLGGDVLEEVGTVKEPHAFLGLLGMTVSGGIRWNGPSEESWRLFWKLYM
ncbi:UNVERIFIED_CONTAM: hypothetical protein HDU68_012576 [Siphonaria sp. JEL0065]|nr:hypothetical protein HDU68_012576 [Siphonaria sp. JEL0065]